MGTCARLEMVLTRQKGPVAVESGRPFSDGGKREILFGFLFHFLHSDRN